MRGFLIFLAIVAPVVLMDPSFWSLWRMETSSERVVYFRDGVTQVGWIGPKSPWPSWAAAPAGAKLHVHASFEPAPGESSSGYADVRTRGPARDVVTDYSRRLADAGWAVQTYRQDLTSADLPPRPLKDCLVIAKSGARGLMLRLDREAVDSAGSLFWSEPPHPVPIGAVRGAC